MEHMPRDEASRLNTQGRTTRAGEAGAESGPGPSALAGPSADAARGFGRFKSCNWLQETVFLDSEGGVRPCYCIIPGPDRNRWITYGLLADESLDLTAERRALQIANQGPEAPCAGCGNFSEGDWRPLDYRSEVQVDAATFCNYDCCYCPCRSKSSQSPVDPGLIADRLEKWMAGGLIHPRHTTICLAAGEPPLNTVLFRLCSDFCLRHGFQMRVFSNCFAASDRMAELAEAGLLQLVTSLDAGAAETYARVHGAGALDRTWANIVRYLEAVPEARKGNIQLKYILLETNLGRGEIDAFAERVERSGVRAVILNIEFHVQKMARVGQVDISKYVDAGGYFLHRLRRVPGLTVTPFTDTWPQLSQELEKRAAEFGRSPDLVAGRLPAETPRGPLPIVHTQSDRNLGLQAIRRELGGKDDFCVYHFTRTIPEKLPEYFFELAGYFTGDSLAEYAARYPAHEKLYRLAAQTRQNADTGGGMLPREWFTGLQIRPDDYEVRFVTDDGASQVFRIDFQYRRPGRSPEGR